MQTTASCRLIRGAHSGAEAAAPHRQRVAPAPRCEATSARGAEQSGSRRGIVLGSLLSLCTVAAGPAGALVRPGTGKEVAAEESPFIQELLRRTEEKREERKAERLKNYYKRNFKEYFEFDAGSEATARARGLSPETAQAVRRWLDENEDERMPGMRKR